MHGSFRRLVNPPTFPLTAQELEESAEKRDAARKRLSELAREVARD